MHLKYRFPYLLATLITMIIGLASRRMNTSSFLNVDFIHEYVGDALWAMMIYWGFRMLFIHFKKQKTALLSIAFSYCIEFSQLYQAEWLNQLRTTTLGGLILGFGFLWSDLMAYCVGIIAAWGIDVILSKGDLRN